MRSSDDDSDDLCSFGLDVRYDEDVLAEDDATVDEDNGLDIPF